MAEKIELSQYRNYDRFVALDFETTGLDAAAQVTEIGAVKVEFGEITAAVSQLIDPCIPIPKAVQVYTGITDEMVAGMPTIGEAIGPLLDFIDGLPIVAHNARFDMRFLLRDAAAAGLQVTSQVVDTLSLARKTWHGLPSYKLTFLTDYFCIDQPDAHRAWCDARAAAMVYLMMREV